MKNRLRKVIENNKPMKKYFKTTLFFTAFLIVFYPGLLKNWIDILVVTPLLSNVHATFLADLVFLIGFILLSIKIGLNIKKNSYISLHQWFFSLIAIGFYTYLRFNQEYVFLGFRTISTIKYFDIVAFYFMVSPISAILLFCKHLFIGKRKNKQVLPTINHLPITKSGNDILGRTKKATQVAAEILITQNEEASAYGIVDKWGGGKTSFLNLLKEKLYEKGEKDQLIFIDFNPWLNVDRIMVVQDFFDTLQQCLKPYSEDVYREFKKYSSSFDDADISIPNKILKELFKWFIDEDLSSEFETINSLLKKLDKKVIVFIDDFDRLEAKEIFDILKLIRNTANFSNFTYIVTYDKDYVGKSLEHMGIPDAFRYSEKIFLREVFLDPVDNDTIREYIKHKLVIEFEENKTDIENCFNDRSDYGHLNSTEKAKSDKFPFVNLRDIHTFLNTFIIDYKDIRHEVVFEEYFWLKVLKFFFYEVYKLLFLEKNRFLIYEGDIFVPDSHNQIKHYRLKNNNDEDIESKKGSIKYFYNFYDSILFSYLQKELNFSDNTLFLIDQITFKLFKINGEGDPKSPLSIVFSSRYQIYFQDKLSEGDLSEKEFIQMINLDNVDTMISVIRKWKEKIELSTILCRFFYLTLSDFSTKNQYENVLKTIFYLANIKTAIFYRGYLGYDYNELYKLFYNKDHKISDQFYNGNIEEFKNFVKSLFNDAKAPYLFESAFLNDLLAYNKDGCILSESEIKEQLNEYKKSKTFIHP